MFPHFRCALRALAGASVVASATAALAQWGPSSSCGCSSPAPRPVAYAPVSSCNSCRPAMQAIPVTQQCFQQVAVTEYQQTRERVRRPVTEVAYVDEPCTTYRPVVETRTVDVPVTSYQDVVEYQTVQKQSGHWVTNYHCNKKVSACEYDPRNDVFGFMNRSAYSVRKAFTPNMVASREWVPQTCVSQVPVTRKVAQTCVQKQSYQVTKYVPETTTRKVAINKVRWEEHEVVALKPITVMKTVSTGTQTAWTYAPAGATVISSAPMAPSSRLSLAPTADPISSRSSSTPTRAANRASDDAFDDRPVTPVRPREAAPRSGSLDSSSSREFGHRDTKSLFVPVGPSSKQASAIARVGGWRATNTATASEDRTPLLLPAATAIASTR